MEIICYVSPNLGTTFNKMRVIFNILSRPSDGLKYSSLPLNDVYKE